MNRNNIVNTKGGIEATMTFSITCFICYKMKASSAKKYFDHPMLFWNDTKKLGWSRFKRSGGTINDSPYNYACSSKCAEKHIERHLDKKMSYAEIHCGKEPSDIQEKVAYADMFEGHEFFIRMTEKHNCVIFYRSTDTIRNVLRRVEDRKDLLESLS